MDADVSTDLITNFTILGMLNSIKNMFQFGGISIFCPPFNPTNECIALPFTVQIVSSELHL